MHSVFSLPDVTAVTAATPEIDADLLVVPVYESDDLADEPGLDAATGGELSRAQASGEFRAKPFDLFITPLTAGGWKARRVAFVGAGPRAEVTAERLRRIAIVGTLAARKRRLASVALVHRAGTPVSPVDAARAFAEGVLLGNYDGAAYKTDGPRPAWLASAAVRASTDPKAHAAEAEAVARGVVLGECTNLARGMSNEPGNHLPPRVFAERGAAIATAAGLKVDVLDETRIAALKMGLLQGVSQGSQEPPRLLVLTYEPAGATPGVTLGLVGKGITFDTGGISIKPALDMDKMKDDMSGGAAVIGAMAAIARLGAPVRCVGVVPMSENMPGGRAIKPGDVLVGASGKTVEILNTDAEGRLVLGDALWYARQLGATHLVDVATLTGACVVALGRSTTGLFATPPSWAEQVHAAGERAGERLWPMPVFDDYRELYKSEIADMANTGGRAAGAITGALFIGEFAEGLPWAHLDIAGTAWADDAKPYQPKGATGVAVRTMAELAFAAAAWAGTGPGTAAGPAKPAQGKA
jgi:leucyl aminopeptidase